MKNILLLIYTINLTLLIIHEIDSAYWKEWVLFKLPGGISFFLFIHFPIIFIALYGMIQVYIFNTIGFVFSYIVAFSGIVCFLLHSYFLRKGHKEFSTFISRALLSTILFVSITQIFITTLCL